MRSVGGRFRAWEPVGVFSRTRYHALRAKSTPKPNKTRVTTGRLCGTRRSVWSYYKLIRSYAFGRPLAQARVVAHPSNRRRLRIRRPSCFVFCFFFLRRFQKRVRFTTWRRSPRPDLLGSQRWIENSPFVDTQKMPFDVPVRILLPPTCLSLADDDWGRE